MTLGSQVRSWMRAMLDRTRMENEMDAELRFHMEAYAEDLQRKGAPRKEAVRRARIEFGGVERAKEECRDARGLSFTETSLQDLRYGREHCERARASQPSRCLRWRSELAQARRSLV